MKAPRTPFTYLKKKNIVNKRMNFFNQKTQQVEIEYSNLEPYIFTNLTK